MATYLFTDGNFKKIEIKNFRMSPGMTAQPDDLDYQEQHEKYTPGGKASAYREALEEKLQIKVLAWCPVNER